MLVTRELSDEISQLLPQLQAELAAETETLVKELNRQKEHVYRVQNLIKESDINLLLEMEIQNWRKLHGFID